MKTDIKTLVKTGLKFTESPRSYNGKLWFLDIHDKQIETCGPRRFCSATIMELPLVPNGFGVTPEGTVVVGDAF